MSLAIGKRIRQALIDVHRWLGVSLCLLFLIWFPTGIVMMYWDFPSVTANERLERSAALDPSTIRVSPIDAATAAAVTAPGQVHLNTFDGRPVYRFGAGRHETIVYADTGEEQIEVSNEMRDRIAAAWTGQPVSGARGAPIEDVDQWTIQTPLSDVEPLWKYSWPDGQDVYVSQASGEVVQYTTTGSRWAARLGAIPHWLYFTPLRKHGPVWNQVVIWTSGIGTFAASLGLVIGVWMYSPSKRYRYGRSSTSIPYRGQKRWHVILGLVFGLGAVTWAFSGMLSMDPFPVQRTGGAGRGGGGRTAAAVPQALRGRLRLDSFMSKSPPDAVLQMSGASVKDLEWLVVAGQPAYLATLAGGDTRVIPLDGPPQREFSRQQLIDVIATAAQDGLAETVVLDHYDRYYADRRRERPLPVILARLNDADHTRYYIDPKTARVVGAYSSQRWITRWVYHGLHSLDFPWLYAYRPLWDIVVIAMMLGGTALCLTSLVLAWRVLGQKLRSALGEDPLRELAPTDDLVS